MNLNKFFPWLSIRNKLLIAFAGLSILPLAFVGVYSILSNVRLMRSVALGELTEDVQTIRDKSENFLDDIYSDLRVLQNSSFVESWMANGGTSPPKASVSDLRGIATELMAFATTKGIYYQFRLLGESGDELLRVECDRPDDSVRTYRAVSASELRQNRETYYFLLVRGLANDQIAFTPAEVLGAGEGRIPVVSFAVPLVWKHRRKGILIANVFERKLIEVVENKNGAAENRTVVLATADGHYLYRSDMQKDWNRLLASRDEDNLRSQHTPTVVEAILSGKTGTVFEGMKDIISYAPLFGGNGGTHSYATTSSFVAPIFVFESESSSVVFGPVRSYALTYVGFLLLFLIGAVVLGLIATRQITTPIAELQRGAEVIAHGNYVSPLHVETHDEIEKLADQFNRMASSLKEHEQEIQKHRTQLERMVAQRTHELQEEKGKLQAVLDNVPSAFVLLDRSFRIQTVSAAFASVTGIALRDIDRMNPFRLVGVAGTGVANPWERAAQTGKIETLLQQLDEEGKSRRFLEYLAIPMRDDNGLRAVVVIITDITRRKNLEQQLVRTERLMAAGEMSSIIAHEFRNALTSVKMILQLFVESERATRNEKKSLAVALDSIYHMETIVTELLNFARPKPVQLAMTDLNKVVQESLDFVNPHIQQHDVKVVVSLDRKIVQRPLDASRMKEAIINLLLNALQAMDGERTPATRHVLDISTKRVRLEKTVRDVGYRENVSGADEGENGSEVVLERGSDCVVIEIRDSGKGIQREELRRIFDPFYTTKTNGTGLGLPMVKRTVLAHGGIVTVESVPGNGTTFRIYVSSTYEERPA